MKTVRLNKAAMTGALLIVVAASFVLGALQLKLGTAQKMGPGYFPLVLGCGLAMLGLGILVSGLRRPQMGNIVIPTRAILCIGAGILFFATTVRGLGLGPSMLGAVFIVAMADRRNTVLSAFLTGLFMAVFSWLVFKVGLGIVLPLFGPWVGGY